MPDLDALTDEQKARLAALLDLPDEQLDALAGGGLVLTPDELLALTGSADPGDAGGEEGEDEDVAAGTDEDDLAMEIAAMTDEEFAAMQVAFEAEQHQEEPVAAGLSAEAQFSIDLAVARQEETARELSVITARLREQDYQAEKRKLADLGVPPFITELARPLLEGAGRAVELANGKTADAGQIMRQGPHRVRPAGPPPRPRRGTRLPHGRAGRRRPGAGRPGPRRRGVPVQAGHGTEVTRVVTTVAVTLPATGGSPAQLIPKGSVLEESAAEAAAISSAGGSTRAVSTTTMHDQLGECAGVSNGN